QLAMPSTVTKSGTKFNYSRGQKQPQEEVEQETARDVRMPHGLPTFRTGPSKTQVKSPMEFLRRFENLCIASAVSRRNWFTWLVVCLTRKEEMWFRNWQDKTHAVSNEAGWFQFKEDFVNHYVHFNYEITVLEKLSTLKVNSREVKNYADRF